ncbi:hypothetical protein ACEPPN_009056 [Leptodophora sp. 'Broadleaf-Isolate-01']
MKLIASFVQMALLVLSILLLCSIANAAPASGQGDQDSNLNILTSLPNGYTISPLRITGTIDGVSLNHTGSIQEIFSKLAAENPSLVIPEVNTTSNHPSSHSLIERNKRNTECFPIPGTNWPKADSNCIWEGIDYLRKGAPFCWVNAHTCARISCSWNSAIYLCSDYGATWGHSCKYISGYAEDLIHSCTETNIGASWTGREFDTDNYSVYVMSDRC